MPKNRRVVIALAGLLLALAVILVGRATCARIGWFEESGRGRTTKETPVGSDKCCDDTARVNTLAALPRVEWRDTIRYSVDGSDENEYFPLTFRDPKSGEARTVWACGWFVVGERLLIIRFEPDSHVPPESLYGASPDSFLGYGDCVEEEMEEVLLDGNGMPVGFRVHHIPGVHFVSNPSACGRYIAYWSFDPAGDEYDDDTKRRVFGNVYDVVTARRIHQTFVLYDAVATGSPTYFHYPEWSNDGCSVRFRYSYDDTSGTRIWLAR